VLFYSRRANDVTNIYGQLSQLIRENVKSKSVILDGEMTTVYKNNLK
jgi:ATP-dependent DNA ligase